MGVAARALARPWQIFSREFQKHIGATGDSEEEHAATGGRVDHSSAGAKYAMEQNPVLGDFMAYAIAGHHGGLPKGTALFYERLKETIPNGVRSPTPTS